MLPSAFGSLMMFRIGGFLLMFILTGAGLGTMSGTISVKYDRERMQELHRWGQGHVEGAVFMEVNWSRFFCILLLKFPVFCLDNCSVLLVRPVGTKRE